MSDKARPRLRPAPTVHTRAFDGDLVILDLAGGEYLSLDEIGSVLWKCMEDGGTIEEAARRVAAEYDVSLERAIADLEELTDQLVSRGLFVPVEEGT